MPHAAPPDDGGDRGSFTVPEDTFTTSPDDAPRWPPLHRDTARTTQDPPHSVWSLVVGIALVLLSLLLFGIYAPS
jgi:hypothetical protein